MKEQPRIWLSWYRGRLRTAFRSGLGIAGLLVFALTLAGRLDYFQGWLFAGINALMLAVLIVRIPELPSLMKERARPGPATKWWDRIFWVLFGPMNLAVFVLACLDGGRFRWTEHLPLVVYGIAAPAYLAAGTLHFWAIRANPFYSRTVSIQAQKGQVAVAEGPYRYVRHPGYSGIIGMMVSLPLLLGSLWALLPSAAVFLLVTARTVLEDRALRNELPGYVEYAGNVRFRIVPGLW